MRFFKVTTELFIECDTWYNAKEYAEKYVNPEVTITEANLEEVIEKYPNAKLVKVKSFRSIDSVSHSEKQQTHINATKEATKIKKAYRRI